MPAGVERFESTGKTLDGSSFDAGDRGGHAEVSARSQIGKDDAIGRSPERRGEVRPDLLRIRLNATVLTS
jgi:hypothetical protein